jgi:hypothetical protein
MHQLFLPPSTKQARNKSLESQMKPQIAGKWKGPTAYPKGMSITAVFQVISEARLQAAGATRISISGLVERFCKWALRN